MQLQLGDGGRSCCDVSQVGEMADCGASSSKRRKRQTNPDQIEGENRPLNIGSNYTYYVITATPADNEVLFLASKSSKEFSSNISERSSDGFYEFCRYIIVITCGWKNEFLAVLQYFQNLCEDKLLILRQQIKRSLMNANAATCVEFKALSRYNFHCSSESKVSVRLTRT